MQKWIFKKKGKYYMKLPSFFDIRNLFSSYASWNHTLSVKSTVWIPQHVVRKPLNRQNWFFFSMYCNSRWYLTPWWQMKNLVTYKWSINFSLKRRTFCNNYGYKICNNKVELILHYQQVILYFFQPKKKMAAFVMIHK